MPSPALADKDVRTLAREILGMDVDAYRAAFRGSPMKRAKLRAMQRNAAIVPGNVGTPDDIAVLTPALDDAEPLEREHAVGQPPRPARRARPRRRGAGAGTRLLSPNRL